MHSRSFYRCPPTAYHCVGGGVKKTLRWARSVHTCPKRSACVPASPLDLPEARSRKFPQWPRFLLGGPLIWRVARPNLCPTRPLFSRSVGAVRTVRAVCVREKRDRFTCKRRATARGRSLMSGGNFITLRDCRAAVNTSAMREALVNYRPSGCCVISVTFCARGTNV